MKTSIITIIAASQLLCCTFVAAQDLQAVSPTLPGSNVQINPYPVSNTIEGKLVTERSVYGEKIITVQHHFDGFGREVKSVSVGASPTGRDIVLERVYTCMGNKDSILYLPSVPDSLGNTLNAATRTRRFYKELFGNDPDANFPTVRTVYDRSPLNLVTATDAPGINHSYASATGHPTLINHRLNLNSDITLYADANASSFYPESNAIFTKSSDGVKKYEIRNDSLLFFSGYYPMSVLTVKEVVQQTTDSLTVSTLEYRDREGHLIAKEMRVNGQSQQFTYNVYNDFGRLCYEIPSIQDKQITSPGTYYSPDQLADYCSFHGYDSRGHEIITIMPGRQRILGVYDQRGRIVLTQDGNQRTAGRWLYTKYDDLDRPIETHLLILQQSWEDLKRDFSDLSGTALHARISNITTADVLLSKNRYGGYTDYELADYDSSKQYDDFRIPADLGFVAVANVVSTEDVYSDNTGLKIYDKVAILPDVHTDTTAYVERAYYYDKEGRIVQLVERNHLKGVNRLSYRYDKAGNMLTNHSIYKPGPTATADILITHKTYDNFNRPLIEQTRFNNGPIARISYVYDVLGRVSKVIQGAGKINTTYKYGIRGSLTEQQNELFRMTLARDKPLLSGSVKNYDGQISECSWAYPDERYYSSYSYRYTPQGQLQDAKHYRNGQLQIASYDETGMRYDDNDNILSLKRYGNGRIANDIRYDYAGNRLVSTTDQGRTVRYDYDMNGNVAYTSENACKFQYNDLNLVEQISRYGSVVARYKYLADGTKLEVSDRTGCGYLYFGSLIYSKRGDTYTPESVGVTGGRIVCTSTGSQVRYFITDYLGSVRVVADQDGRALEKINYYPFGKRWDAADLPISGNRYLFNGKEWQATGDVNLLDYGARMYDPNLGRWFVQDPLYQMLNPYSFCYSNPVNFMDPTGLWTQSPNGVVTDNEEDIKQILNDIADGTFDPKNYAKSSFHYTLNGELHWMPFWLWYADQIGGGAGGGGRDWIEVAEDIADYLGIAGLSLTAIGPFTGPGVPYFMTTGSCLSLISDGIYITTDLIKGKNGLATYRIVMTILFNAGPAGLIRYAPNNGKNLIQVTFAAHEAMVDEVANQVENK